MKRTQRPVRPRRASLPFALLALATLAACAPGEVVEITERRQVRDLPPGLQGPVPSAARFGGGLGVPASNPTPQESPFRYVLPEGWEELEPTSMRLLNLRPGGDPATECALTVLGGDGGGLTANINRWRDQIGLAPITEAEAQRLPKTVLLGQQATIVDLRGDYKGMGDEAKADYGLLGLVLMTEQFTLFLKMTGPAEVVQAERPNFERFYASLTAVFPGQEDPHARAGAGAPPAGDGEHRHDGPGLDYSLPDGWRELPAKGMRVVNLEVGASQCYVIELAGEAGGLVMNLNRWRGEVGLPPIDQAGVARLEPLSVMGQAAPLLEITGTYEGMGGPTGQDSRVLGVPIIRPTTSLFVKMVGPNAEVLAQRDSFLRFVASLHEH